MDFEKSFSSQWITDGIDEDTVTFADKFGCHLCDLSTDNRGGRMAMTTSQIRNVFGEVKRIQAKGYKEEKASFLLLRPKLAYAEARVIAKSGRSRIQDFRKVMEKAHIAVKNEVHFQNFVDFLEATLAYHKFYGGRD
jgi:CRISPR-associated protein Csm2